MKTGIAILFFIIGLYSLISAKIPSWLVGDGYKAEGNKVRLIGALAAIILPGALLADFPISIVGVFVINFAFAIRNIRVPDESSRPYKYRN